MAEEFEQLPTSLQNISFTLMHNRKSRTAFICGVIILMSVASSVRLLTSLIDVSPCNTSVDSERFVTKNTEEVIMNLFLTASIQQNITVLDSKVITFNESACDEICMRHFIDLSKMENVMKNSGNFSITHMILNRDNYENNDTTLFSNLNNKNVSYHFYESTNLVSNRNENGCELNTETCSRNRMKRASMITNVTFNKTAHNKIQSLNKLRDKGLNTLTKQVFFENANAISTDKEYLEYIVFTWVLCLVALATALKLYYLIKTFLAVVMIVVYVILILIPFRSKLKE